MNTISLKFLFKKSSIDAHDDSESGCAVLNTIHTCTCSRFNLHLTCWLFKLFRCLKIQTCKYSVIYEENAIIKSKLQIHVHVIVKLVTSNHDLVLECGADISSSGFFLCFFFVRFFFGGGVFFPFQSSDLCYYFL